MARGGAGAEKPLRVPDDRPELMAGAIGPLDIMGVEPGNGCGANVPVEG